MIDYDKLFKNGNFVALRNTKVNQTFYYFVTNYYESIKKDKEGVDWAKYYNPDLSYTGYVDDCGKTLFKIMFIAELDFETKKVHVLYDRENNINEALITPAPMPTLETGYIVEVHTDEGYQKGVVVGDNIIYQNGGFDYIEGFNEFGQSYDEDVDHDGDYDDVDDDYCIVKIWNNYGYGFDHCNDDCLIWQKEEN